MVNAKLFVSSNFVEKQYGFGAVPFFVASTVSSGGYNHDDGDDENCPNVIFKTGPKGLINSDHIYWVTFFSGDWLRVTGSNALIKA